MAIGIVAMAAPSPKLKLGILSTAAIAVKNILAARASGLVEVIAVASRDLARAQAWAAKNDIAVAYGSYEELLADSTIQGVYVPLPTGLRKEWVVKVRGSVHWRSCKQVHLLTFVQAAIAGKHVLCEKPCAVSTTDLQEMVSACEASGVVFSTSAPFVTTSDYHPCTRCICICSGWRHVHARCASRSKRQV